MYHVPTLSARIWQTKSAAIPAETMTATQVNGYLEPDHFLLLHKAGPGGICRTY